jgi:5-methyltetrahydropteroyltriglutamate--homocysteine methyltransferase
MQREVGIDVLSDGEFRRGAFLSDLTEAVEGFVPDTAVIEWKGPEGRTEQAAAHVAASRLRQVRRLAGHESAFLKEHASGAFKVTLPSPTLFTHLSFKPGVTDRVYASRSELLQDLVAIVRGEVRTLLDEGVPYVQLDAPRYTYYIDPRLREELRQSGEDPDQALVEAIAADNACLAGAPRDGATLAIHLCRGNNRSRWYAEGGYDAIAEQVFGGLQVDTFLLEYDTERSGGFEPLRFVPRGKTVVLGLISTKERQLEDQDTLRRRIDEAARYVPVEDLALSPQCGFASMASGNLLSPDDQRRKLELVADTARKVWG